MNFLYSLNFPKQPYNFAFTSFPLLITIRRFSTKNLWSTSSWIFKIDKWITARIHLSKQVPLRGFDLPREKCAEHISLFIGLAVLAREKHLYQVFARIILKFAPTKFALNSGNLIYDILFIRRRLLLYAEQDIQSQRLFEEFLYHDYSHSMDLLI